MKFEDNNETQALQLLLRLNDYARDPSAASDSSREDLMRDALEYISSVSSISASSPLHWFCNRAPGVVTECATFLLRLHAYENEQVPVWKSQCVKVLHTCLQCCASYQDRKVASRKSYLSDYPDSVLDTFFSQIDSWEATAVNQAIHAPGSSSDSLSDGIVYHILSNTALLRDDSLFAVVKSSIMSGFRVPSAPVPSGLILMLTDSRSEVQTLSGYLRDSFQPIGEPAQSSVGLLNAMLRRLSGRSTKKTSSTPLWDTTLPAPQLWDALPGVLRMFLPTPIRAHFMGKNAEVNLKRIVIGNLASKSNFSGVLSCFVQLVKTLGNLIWADEDAKYPEVVFDMIKDNPAMSSLLSVQSRAKSLWNLEWLQDYLESIWDLPTFPTVLPKVIFYLGEELQHVATDSSVHWRALRTLFKIICALNEKSSSLPYQSIQMTALRDACDTHAQIIARAALTTSPSPNDDARESRILAWTLLRSIFLSDGTAVTTYLHQLCSFRDEQWALVPGTNPSHFSRNLPPGKKLSRDTLLSPLPSPVRIHTRVWSEAYHTMARIDPDASALLLVATAPTAHIDLLLNKSHKPFSSSALKHHPDPLIREAFELTVKSINSALSSMREGFLKQVEGFAASCGRAGLRAFLAKPEIVKSLLHLLLSSTRDLYDGAEAIVVNAYDAVERSACFFALFERHPLDAFKGVASYLKVFNDYATIVPAACDVSKSLVRSLKEILDGLGEPSGLLSRPDYGLEAKLDLVHWLPELWRLMSCSLSIIFQRTKFWAPYFQTEDMVVWMRDALIFGRDMVSYVETLQGAVRDRVASRTNGKGKPGSARLIADLSHVLTQLIEWLKITDRETLHQTHELLKALLACFATSSSEPPHATIETLERYSERKKGTRTELSDGKLSELLSSLQPFLDDVRVIETTPVAAKRSVPTKGKAAAPRGNGEQKSAGAKERKPGLKANSSAGAVTSAQVGGFARRETESAPVEDTSMLAIRNYMKMQEKETSNILSGPIRPATRDIAISSSSDDSDSQESDDGLASLREKSPKKLKKIERRGIKLLPIPAVPGKLNRHEEARRRTLRLKPDLSLLHRHILQWDYDHDGPEPPDSKLVLSAVPDSFPGGDNAITNYQEIFEPLVLLEAWSAVVASKDEDLAVLQVEITSRRHTDTWVDLDVVTNQILPLKWSLNDTDIVLLRPLDGVGNVLCKVAKSKRNAEGLSASLRCSLQTDRLRAIGFKLSIRSQWRMNRVYSLSTVQREFGALVGLAYYDLFPSVMDPPRRPLCSVSSKDVSETMATYGVNEPQARAICGSLRTTGFSLIQGPPGTGKTSTIMGLVGTFLSKRPPPITRIQAGRSSVPADKDKNKDKDPPQKILICAPSNAAIDEVAYRLKQGIRTSGGSTFVPRVVRVGNEEKMSPLVKDLSLDELVGAMLSNDPKATDLSTLREHLSTLTARISANLDEANASDTGTSRASSLETELRDLRNERARLVRQLDAAKDKNESLRRNRDSNTRKFEAQVLHDADVICATLSGSGHSSLTPFTFETVIIDEAAQSVELSSLIPLKYGTKQAILVGDPQQLAPTVLSSRAAHFLYNQSLFVRLQKRQPAYLLSIQYRMHPDISRLPSRVFYDSKLKDAEGMTKLRTMPWHASLMFRPYQFFDVADGREEKADSGYSLRNHAEVRLAVLLYERLVHEFTSQVDLYGRVGIIAMYDAQKRELQQQFVKKFGKDITNRVAFGTVDGFQGQEKDIVIVSAVRGGPSVSRIGHVSDVRRMNVAVTRARASLFILGNALTLERSDGKWKGVVQDARERKLLVKVELSRTGGRLPTTFSDTTPTDTTSARVVAAPEKPPSPISSNLAVVRPPQVTIPIFKSQQGKEADTGVPSPTPPADVTSDVRGGRKRKLSDASVGSAASAPRHTSPSVEAHPTVHLPRPDNPKRPAKRPKKNPPDLFIPVPPRRPPPSAAGKSNKQHPPT